MKKEIKTFVDIIEVINDTKAKGIEFPEAIIANAFTAHHNAQRYGDVPKIRFNRKKAAAVVFEAVANCPFRAVGLDGYTNKFITDAIMKHFGWTAASCKYCNYGFMGDSYRANIELGIIR